MGRTAIGVTLVSVVWLSLLAAVALAQTSSAPLVAPYTSLVWGWEQFFKITWEPMERQGRPYVAGYVLNDWGSPARRIQLLVDGLDSSGRVLSQTVSWLGQSLTPGTRAYFEVPAPSPAASYRVSVFAFDWVQAAEIQAP